MLRCIFNTYYFIHSTATAISLRPDEHAHYHVEHPKDLHVTHIPLRPPVRNIIFTPALCTVRISRHRVVRVRKTRRKTADQRLTRLLAVAEGIIHVVGGGVAIFQSRNVKLLYRNSGRRLLRDLGVCSSQRQDIEV